MMSTTWSLDLTDHVEVAAPSPTGSSVALGSLGGDVLVVDTATGATTAKLADHPMGVLAAEWSPDGRRLAVGGQDGVLRIYRDDGSEIAVLTLDGWVSDLAWSPDGLLAAAGGRTMVVLGDDGAVMRRHPDQASTVTAVGWSVDGRRVGVAAYGGIRWYEPGTERASNEPARTFVWKGSILSLAVSPTGKWACAGAQDATVQIWRLWSGSDLSMSGYPSKIEQLGFRHDGRWLAVACLGELTIWHFGGRGPSGTRPATGESHDGHITTLAWEPTADRVATGGVDGQVAVWPSPPRSGRKLQPQSIREHTASVGVLAWAGSGGPLVIGYADGSVRCHEIPRDT